MNELMVVIDNEDWFYYETEKESVHEALNELRMKLANIGVNFDDMIYMRCELRNSNEETIDVEEML